jgi:hypothetical protein
VYPPDSIFSMIVLGIDALVMILAIPIGFGSLHQTTDGKPPEVPVPLVWLLFFALALLNVIALCTR